jgi:hypothetical protein
VTFDEIVTEIAARLNIVSAEGITRIGREVNVRYREVTGELSLKTSRQTTVDEDTTIGDRYVTFDGLEKVFHVYDESTPPRMLVERSFDELRSRTPYDSDEPREYAVVLSDASSVTIFLDATPESVFTLVADGVGSAVALEDDDEPLFPASFHDILILGVIADELNKSEKFREAAVFDARFQLRLAALRLHLRSSAFMIQQNRNEIQPWQRRRRGWQVI